MSEVCFDSAAASGGISWTHHDNTTWVAPKVGTFASAVVRLGNCAHLMRINSWPQVACNYVLKASNRVLRSVCGLTVARSALNGFLDDWWFAHLLCREGIDSLSDCTFHWRLPFAVFNFNNPQALRWLFTNWHSYEKPSAPLLSPSLHSISKLIGDVLTTMIVASYRSHFLLKIVELISGQSDWNFGANEVGADEAVSKKDLPGANISPNRSGTTFQGAWKCTTRSDADDFLAISRSA